MPDNHRRRAHYASSVVPTLSAGGRGRLLVLPLVCVLFFCGGARAQDAAPADSTQWRPYQIGFSAAAFVTILEGADAPERYQVYGRYRATRDWALRAALRYEHLFSGDQNLDLTARTGVDRLLRTDGPLRVYGGIDVVAGYTQSPGGDRTYRLGSAPVLGLLLFVTSNVSLSVEPRLVALYSYFDNPGNAANDETLSVEVQGEGLLILSVHF